MGTNEPSWLDVRYNGLSPRERDRQIERDRLLWEQNQKLEENAQLIEEQIEAEKENAQLIAEAEEKRTQSEKEIEQARQDYNDNMRYHKLCDDFGIDYNDISDFEMVLTNDDGTNTEQLYQDFYHFRKEHYARDMEILFRKLKLDLGVIKKEEIKGTGTNDDYIDYIYGFIMDNSSLIESIKEYGSDKLLLNVIEYVIENQEFSLKLIQEEFNINSRRADRIIHQMEERGIVFDKKVLMTKEAWKKIMNMPE